MCRPPATRRYRRAGGGGREASRRRGTQYLTSGTDLWDRWRSGPARRLELIHGEHGTGQVGNGEYTDESRRRKRGKGPLAHREVVGMVGEDGGCRSWRILAASHDEDGDDSEAWRRPDMCDSSWRTCRTPRSYSRSWLGLMLTMSAGRRRGGDSGAREHAEQKKTKGR
jgi:hypothetical protein